MQKVISALIIMVMLISWVSVMAANLPSSFWPVNDEYSQAVSNKDYPKIADTASRSIDIVSALPKDDQTVDIIGSRAYEAAFAYYFMGDYVNARKYFEIYIPYGEEKGWTDGVKIAKEYVKQLAQGIEVYKYASASQKYYGAKNEPQGVLYGQISETMKNEESMVLLYLEYGDTYFDWANVVMKKASAEGKYVELALNFPNQGSTARSISSNDGYLSQLYSLLSSYPDVKVFLRIGAEMNIWGNRCTPDEFISAFRTISSYVKPLSNVACVWSVSHTSTWDVNMNDFYPGDEYVDWVGISVYANKYFNGQHWSNEEKFNEVFFKSGYNADPVTMIKDIVETYGDRKPIMFAECGSAYRTNGSINEDHHEWGAKYLRDMYALVPMVYPQVKLMAYFNKNMSYENNYYDLDGSSPLTKEYYDITNADWFIHSGESMADIYFEKVWDTISTDGSFTLGAYPKIYGADSITVDYYIDNQHYASVYEAPYDARFENITGTRNLHVVATGDNGAVVEWDYVIKSSAKAENEGQFNDTYTLNSVQNDAIAFSVDAKVVNGYDDGTFRPFNTITRGEFATIISRFMGYEAEEKCTFSDAYDHWASPYINACVKAGAINGIGNNCFAPDDNITYEQAVKIISVVCGVADGSESYPYGFIEKAEDAGLLENLTDGSKEIEKPFNRVNSVMMLYNVKNMWDLKR